MSTTIRRLKVRVMPTTTTGQVLTARLRKYNLKIKVKLKSWPKSKKNVMHDSALQRRSVKVPTESSTKLMTMSQKG